MVVYEYFNKNMSDIKNISTIQKIITVGALAFFLFTLLMTDEIKSSLVAFNSVEVGVATPAPSGGQGLAIPASCPSFEHSIGACTTTNVNLTCDNSLSIFKGSADNLVARGHGVLNRNNRRTVTPTDPFTFTTQFNNHRCDMMYLEVFDRDNNGRQIHAERLDQNNDGDCNYTNRPLPTRLLNKLENRTRYNFRFSYWWATGGGYARYNGRDSDISIQTVNATYNECAIEPPPTLAPTVTISQSAASTTQNDPFTISWTTNGDTNVCNIQRREPDGTFQLWDTSTGSGSKVATEISPTGSYRFRARCANASGVTAYERLDHDVLAKAPDFSVTPKTIDSGDTIRIRWTCYYSNFGSTPYSWGTLFSTGGNTSGNISIAGPTEFGTYDYQLSCKNGGFGQQTVKVRNPATTISASPTIVNPGGVSSITWSAANVDRCTVTGTDGFSESKNLSVGGRWDDVHITDPITEQTTYTLTCESGVRSATDIVNINLNPTFEEI